MGKQIYLDQLNQLLDNSPVVDFASIQRLVGKKDYAKVLISNLLKKKKIYKLGKGCYTKHQEVSLSVFCFKPAYLGLQNALSYHRIWEQETIPVILTVKKTRRGIRTILDSNVLVRHIDKKYFFGFEYVKEGQFYIPYSDLEKTSIDMVVFNLKIDKEVLKILKKRIDPKKLKQYLKKYPLVIRQRVQKILE